MICPPKKLIKISIGFTSFTRKKWDRSGAIKGKEKGDPEYLSESPFKFW
jgi:hypothetical protein